MKDIEELINNVKKYNNCLVQRRFKSRKNTVAYVLKDNQPRILKWFPPGLKNNMDNEYEVLVEGSKDLDLPFVYSRDKINNVLIMNYFIGENLCDVINDNRRPFHEKQRIVVLLSEWFARFHIYFKTNKDFRIRGDAILRNFIISNSIVGVDFEESRIGKTVEDIATMCASLLSSDPMFTFEKFQLCKIFILTYMRSVKWDLENFNQELSYSLLQRIQWRPEDEKILRRYADKVKYQGFSRTIP
jgi:tRNA A-37 threonylcarbamoyl transferase component Bud32